MKKILLLTTLALFFSLQSIAQRHEWKRAISENTNYNIHTKTSGVDSSGNLYVINKFYNDIKVDLVSQGLTKRMGLGSGNNLPIALTKFDKEGVHLWSRAISLYRTNLKLLEFSQIQIYAHNDEVYITVPTNGITSWLDTLQIHMPSSATTDTLITIDEVSLEGQNIILCITSQGYFKSMLSFNGIPSDKDDGEHLCINDDRVAVVSSTSVSNIIFFDKQGNIIDTNYFSNTYSAVKSMQFLHNSNSYVVLSDPSQTKDSAYVVSKYDINHNRVATFNIESGTFNGFNYSPQLYIDRNNNIYVLGNTIGTFSYMGYQYQNNKNGMLLKLDSNLKAIWAIPFHQQNTSGALITSRNGIMSTGNKLYISSCFASGILFYKNKSTNDTAASFITILDTAGNLKANFGYKKNYGKIHHIALNRFDEENMYLVQEGQDSILINGTREYVYGIIISKLAKSFSEVRGTMFFDLNSNNQIDNGENPVKHAFIDGGDNNNYITSNNGTYVILVDTGTTTITPYNRKYYNISPSSVNVNISNYDSSVIKNFALQPAGNINDLEIYLTTLLNFARPGSTVIYRLTAKNVGTTTLNPTVKLTYDSLLTFQNSGPVQTTHTYPELTWSLTNFKPGDEKNFTVRFSLATPPAANIGDTLCSFAEINPLTNDTTENNNKDTLYQFVRGSYDPNIKETNKPEIIDIEKVNGSFPIDYTIHFQNTGNDTAFHVYLIDTLDADLKIVSIEILSASHDYEFSISENNSLRWDYYNILLVDSNTNEPESHGFVKYRVWTKDNPGIGDEFTNNADIYFDFNEPVRTNTTKNTIDKIESVELLEGKTITVYPNPTSGSINVTIDLDAGVDASIKVIDLTGKQVYVESTTTGADGLKQTINLADLPQGIYFVQVYANNQVCTAKVVKR